MVILYLHWWTREELGNEWNVKCILHLKTKQTKPSTSSSDLIYLFWGHHAFLVGFWGVGAKKKQKQVFNGTHSRSVSWRDCCHSVKHFKHYHDRCISLWCCISESLTDFPYAKALILPLDPFRRISAPIQNPSDFNGALHICKDSLARLGPEPGFVGVMFQPICN